MSGTHEVSKKVIRKLADTLPTGRAKWLFVEGNSKLGKCLILNLPPILTCPGATAHCNKVCYACRNFHVFKTTMESNADRYVMVRAEGFVNNAIAEIKRHRSFKYVRFHASGDCFSEKYILDITKVVKACPDKLFLLYTKSYMFNDALKELEKNTNIAVFESLDVSRPEQKSTLTKVAMISDTPIEGFFDCTGDCRKCGPKEQGYMCWNGIKKVRFHEH